MPFEILHTDGPATNMRQCHWHDFEEISYIRFGRGRFELQDDSFDVEPGDFVLIRAKEKHRVTYDERQPLFESVMHFSSDFLCPSENEHLDSHYLDLFRESPQKGHHLVRPGGALHQRMADLTYDIEAEYKRRQPFFEIMIKSKLLTLVTCLIRHAGVGAQIGLDESPRNRETRQRIASIAKYITDRATTDVTLDQVADQFAMNRSYFSSYFHKHLGLTFSEFLWRARVDVAIPLLVSHQMRVIDVGYECGFNAPASFYRAFRSVTGTTPRRFVASLEER